MELFKITDKLAIVTRPRGDDWLTDDLTRLRAAGIGLLISCLTTAEEVDLGLEREAEEARSTGLEFVRLPIDDRSTPEQQAVDDVVDSIAPKLAAGVKIAVHCRQGLGRAPLVAGAILVRMGLSADEAWASIEGGRGQPVPDTQEQSEWLRRFASRSGL